MTYACVHFVKINWTYYFYTFYIHFNRKFTLCKTIYVSSVQPAVPGLFTMTSAAYHTITCWVTIVNKFLSGWLTNFQDSCLKTADRIFPPSGVTFACVSLNIFRYCRAVVSGRPACRGENGKQKGAKSWNVLSSYIGTYISLILLCQSLLWRLYMCKSLNLHKNQWGTSQMRKLRFTEGP